MPRRNRQASRLHADLEQLRPGYEAKVGKLTTKLQLDRARRLLVGMTSVRAQLARKRVARLREIFAEVDEVTAALVAAARESASRLTSIPGVAELTAGEVLAEVGDAWRFRDQSAVRNG